VNRARVPSSLRKHLRNQKSDSCPGLWAAVRLVGYQGGSEPTAPILVTKGALPDQRRQGGTSQARAALTKTPSGSAITQPRAPELKVRAFWRREGG
jgi:hypothetical protein